MGHLTHDEFFTKLTDLFNARKGSDHGAIYLTQKRLSHPTTTTTSSTSTTPPPPQDPSSSAADAFPDLHPAEPLPILIRATNGKSKSRRAAKVKLSTVVEPAQLEAFYARYAEVCKAGMAALKPRDRTRRKAKARKRKGGAGAGAGPAS